MSQSTVTLLLSTTAIVALVGLGWVLRAQRRDWNISAWLIFSMGWLAELPSAFGSFTGGKVRSLDALHNPITVLSGRTVQLTHLCNYAELALPLIIILFQLPKRRIVNVLPLLGALLCAVAALASGLNGFPLFSKSAFILFVALVAVALMPTGRGACLGAAAFVLSLAAVSGLVTLVNYQLGTAPCVGLYKCGPLGIFVFGVVDNENGLALILAAGLAFVWFAIRNAWWRNVLFLYVLGMVAVSGARTSLIAGLVLLGALLVFGFRIQIDQARPTVPFARQAGVLVVLLGAIVYSAQLPFTTNDPNAYTSRGTVWLIARERLAGHYGIGLGQPAWASLVKGSTIESAAGYSTHNQWLDVLWISGFVGLAIFAIILLKMLRRDVVLASLLLLPMVVLGAAERAWGISHFDGISYAYLASLAAIPMVAGPKSTSKSKGAKRNISAVHRRRPELCQSGTRSGPFEHHDAQVTRLRESVDHVRRNTPDS
jgi:hypothetical protein